MQKTLVLASAAALIAFSAPAFAQTAIIVDEPDPVMTESTTVVVPGEVRTYVLEQDVPSATYDGDVLIGKVIPDAVEVRPIEEHPDYAYSVINERRVIIDPQTRTVVEVLD